MISRLMEFSFYSFGKLFFKCSDDKDVQIKMPVIVEDI